MNFQSKAMQTDWFAKVRIEPRRPREHERQEGPNPRTKGPPLPIPPGEPTGADAREAFLWAKGAKSSDVVMRKAMWAAGYISSLAGNVERRSAQKEVNKRCRQEREKRIRKRDWLLLDQELGVIGKTANPLADPPASKLKRTCRLVADRHGVTPEQIAGRARTAHTVAARHEFWGALHSMGYGFNAIGRVTDRDHTTIRAGVLRHAERVAGQ